ncbi:hypothetical protein [Yersinia bercovieri]|uniref:hypothetical protein n=1 Tax=Yersinia bercovieri TaxID=634 RepID=UPI001CFCEE63|nr:hypothetical protein [Yersinia bercovieri]MCB5301176.1 hypothetical protein [Yersinia bercovieri]
MSIRESNYGISKEDWDLYHLAIRNIDIATCEACAVSNAIGVRESVAYKGWSTYIYTRLCSHAVALIAATPISRWSKREYESWDITAIAPHVRALMEGEILFYYLSKTPISQDEWSAKLNVMHLNDCIKRIEITASDEIDNGLPFYSEQKDEITARLDNNSYFQSLDSGTIKRCLAGKVLTIQPRDILLSEMGVSPKDFKKLFDLLSHYIHILPMSFYRMEPNGRGAGCLNETDFHYMYIFLNLCTEVLTRCTDIMVDLFPDVKSKRKGLKSKVSIGPKPRK